MKSFNLFVGVPEPDFNSVRPWARRQERQQSFRSQFQRVVQAYYPDNPRTFFDLLCCESIEEAVKKSRGEIGIAVEFLETKHPEFRGSRGFAFGFRGSVKEMESLWQLLQLPIFQRFFSAVADWRIPAYRFDFFFGLIRGVANCELVPQLGKKTVEGPSGRYNDRGKSIFASKTHPTITVGDQVFSDDAGFESQRQLEALAGVFEFQLR